MGDLTDIYGDELVLENLQGNVLRGYTKPKVRYVVLKVNDAGLARRWLGQVSGSEAGDLPLLTNAGDWGKSPPEICFNISMTAAGLRALGVRGAQLESFPIEFVKGMHTRGNKIGDVEDSAPKNWPAPFDKPEDLHVIVTLYAADPKLIESTQEQLLSYRGGAAFTLLGVRDGANFDGAKVHFGYTDSLSQPRFRGIHDPERYPDKQPLSPLGSVLLGFQSVYEDVDWRVPSPKALGYMGSFNAFRVLEQDAPGFEAFLDHAADVVLADPRGKKLLPKGTDTGNPDACHAAMREVVAAQMCGRWRNGVPLELSPDTPDPKPELPRNQWSNFDYGPEAKCPFGAHMRRCNPRGGAIVQRIANNTRRLVRRGMPYGPAYDPAKPDDEKRGLLGNFICGNLAAQFEAVMCDWLNLGLEDPHITGTNDAMLGANDPEISFLDIFLPDRDTIRVPRLPRLVHVRGGAYMFIPSIPACQYMASL